MKLTHNKPTLADSLLSNFFNTGFPFNDIATITAPFAGGNILTGDTVRFNSTAESFTVEVDLPGARREDTQVEITGNQVFINAKRTITSQGGVKEEVLTRSFTLDKDADVDTIQARQENGVLTISAKRKDLEKFKKRTLKIN